MQQESFRGDRKVGEWWTARIERAFVARTVAHVPPWLETYHLTWMTLGWSALVLVAGYAAGQGDLRWLWGISVAVVGQYLSDLYDGAVGRYRDTGLVRWGFYMDHLLDFAFLSSIAIAYHWVVPASDLPWLLLLTALLGALMAHTFLAFGADGEFRISQWGIGPTELRVALVAGNTWVAAQGGPALGAMLPGLCGAAALALALGVLRTQRHLWARDMAHKNTPPAASSGTL